METRNNNEVGSIANVELLVRAAGAEARGEYAQFLKECAAGDAAFLGNVFSPVVRAGSWAKWKVLGVFGKKPPTKMDVALRHVKKAFEAAKNLPPHVQLFIGGTVLLVGGATAIYFVLKKNFPEVLERITDPIHDTADEELREELERTRQQLDATRQAWHEAKVQAARADEAREEARALLRKERAELTRQIDERDAALEALMQKAGLTEAVEKAAEAVSEASDEEAEAVVQKVTETLCPPAEAAEVIAEAEKAVDDLDEAEGKVGAA